MGDESTELRIHIVSDSDNAGFKSAGGAAADLGDSTKTAADATGALDESQKKNTATVATSTSHHRELRMALNELNKIVPGLGHVVNMLEEGWRRSASAATEVKAASEGAAVGFQAEAAAADEATVANESFIASAGPFAILLLGLQAGITAWEFYKSGAKAAQDAASEAFAKANEEAHKAIDAFHELQDAMNPKDAVTKKYSDEIERQNALLDAQLKANKDILTEQEKTAMAGAKTPEEKAAVKEFYAHQSDNQEGFGKQAKADIDKGVIVEIQGELGQREKDAENIRQSIGAKNKARHGGTITAENDTTQDTKDLEEQAKAIRALTEQLRNLTFKSGTATEVAGIDATGKSAVDREKSNTVAAEDLAKAEDMAAKGPQTDAEQQFVLRLAQAASGQRFNLQQSEEYLKALQQSPQAMKASTDRLGAAFLGVMADTKKQLDELARQIEAQGRQHSNTASSPTQ